MAYTKRLGSVKVLKELSSSSSDGELLKWQVEDKYGSIWWLKSSSFFNQKEMYECESECIACRIAELFGISNVVMYDMDTLKIGIREYKVCRSADFVRDKEIITLAEYVPHAVYLQGYEKYNAIANALPDYVEQLNKIIVFDAIIYNKDRHLNNLALVDSDLILFDNGASLFGRDASPKLAYNACSFNYQSCKPFYSTVKNQLNLISGNCLQSVSIEQLAQIVTRFLDKGRAKWVIKLLARNLKEVDRFWK